MTLLPILLALFSCWHAQDTEGETRVAKLVRRQEQDSIIYLIAHPRFRKGDLHIEGDFAVVWIDVDRYQELTSRNKQPELLNRPQLPTPDKRLQPKGFSDWYFNKLHQAQAAQDDVLLNLESFREIYIEGAVYFSAGEKRIIHGERLYMDMTTGRMVVLEGKLQAAPNIPGATSLTVRAELFRKEASGLFVADNAKYSTCNFGVPHYHIHSDQLWIKEYAQGTILDAYDSTVVFGETGVLGLPRIKTDSADTLPYFRRASVGGSKTFGVFTLTEWGDSFYSLGEAFNDKVLNTNAPFKGEWLVNLDFMKKRGVGVGPELKWKSPDLYQGKLNTYLLHDEGEPFYFYRRQLVRDNSRRGHIEFENRAFLNAETTLDTELYYTTDPSFRAEFFRSDFYREKTPETDAYLRWARENQVFTALTNYEINRFAPVPATGYGLPLGVAQPRPFTKESLPELQHKLFYEPLFRLPLPGGFGEDAKRDLPVYYTEESSLGYLRRRPAQDLEFVPNTVILLDESLQDSGRLSTRHELRAPFYANPLIITPFVAEQLVAYSDKSTGSGALERLISTVGTRVSTQISGQPFENYFHYIDPSVTYQNVYSAKRDPLDLIPFDEIDTLQEREEIIFGLRNRLVSVSRYPEPVEDFAIYYDVKEPQETDTSFTQRATLDLDLRLPYYPEAQRDNLGRDFGDLEMDLDYLSGISQGPLRGWRSRLEVFYDFEKENQINFLQASTSVNPWQNLWMTSSYRVLRDIPNDQALRNILGLASGYNIGEKWRFYAAKSFDFKQERDLGHSLGFVRLGHDWVFEARFTVNRNTDEILYTFNISPRTLYERGVALFRPGTAVNLSNYEQGNTF